MRILTLRQPWAWAVAGAGKRAENRSWRTHYRGPLAIHAGLAVDPAAIRWLRDRGVPAPDADAYVRGAIVAVCELTDCDAPQPAALWDEGPWCWRLTDVREVAPLAYRGAQGLGVLPAEIAALLRSPRPVPPPLALPAQALLF